MNFFKLLILLFCFNASVFGQNSMVLKNVTAGAGEQTKLHIALENKDAVTGFQFTLQVPQEVVLKEQETSFVARNKDHIMYPKNLGNGEYLFLCFSTTNANFTGNTGDLLEIPLEVPLSYTVGQVYDIRIKEVIVSSEEGVDIGSDHQNATLTVTQGKTSDLIVENIIFPETEIHPGEKFIINWDVKNIGKSIASGGWKEQIYITTQNEEQTYLLGNVSYDNDLIENSTIRRGNEFDIPAFLGFDGDVKIKIVIKPNASVRETEEAKLNNTTLSAINASLIRKLTFIIDKTQITKNSVEDIRVELTRSGSTAEAEEFTITADDIEEIDLPITMVIDAGQSSAVGYVKLKPSATYTGDKDIIITVTATGYQQESANLKLIEDKKISLSIDYSSNYGSAVGDKIVFTLTSSYANDIDKTITFSSDNSKRIQLSNPLILRAGETTLTFEGTILDTGIVEKKEEVNLYADAPEYTTASKAILLGAINVPDFELTLETDKVSERDGVQATFASLKRTTHADKQVTVDMTANLDGQLILPNSLVFAPQELEKRFNIGVIDNDIVEGNRSVTIFSKVKFSGCNCTDDSDPLTLSSKTLRIIDNDGLSLKLEVSPTTIKAGMLNNELTISRNTTDPNILKDPVIVTLSNNLPSVMSLPTSVTIPANQKEVTITFDTRIDTSLEGDQNIRVEATATDYSAGFSWLLVTDQNLPDVVISDIQLPNRVEGGTYIEITSAIYNQGYADFNTGAKVSYYLSANNSIQGIEPFATTILNQTIIKAGETYNLSESIQLPQRSGKLNLIVIVNQEQNNNELSFLNNQNHITAEFLPAYTASVLLDKDIYKPGEKVQISGEAKRLNGAFVSNSDIEITITNNEFSRIFNTKTNSDGVFSYIFEPLENEAGNYTVTAAFPGAKVPAQRTFDLLGFEIVNKPNYIKWEPFVGFPLGKQLILKNNTSVALTDVQISLPPNTGFTIEQTPISLQGGEQRAFSFRILSSGVSTENRYAEVPISITSAEGALLKETVYYFSRTKQANLVIHPINNASINTTMVKDMVRFYEIEIHNQGDVDAKNVEVQLPSVPWLRLKTPKVIAQIKANGIAKIGIELEPTSAEQVNVPITGTFVVKGNNSNTLIIPFRIETVSEVTGKIVVDATDEYTYNTASAPHLAGAKVQIKHPYSGKIIAEGMTDANGLFEVPTINEGYYTVNVSADKHNPYQNNILVDPGKTAYVNAFMQYQAVSYNWDVVATEVVDEYDITLITEFETNVPKPVVVMELDNPNLDLEEGKSRIVNMTITNHGLIAANRVKLGVSNVEDYEIKPLIKSIDTLYAKTTIVVPILVKRNPASLAKIINGKSNTAGCASGNVTMEASYPCNGDQKLFSLAPFYSVKCPEPPTHTVAIVPHDPFGCCSGDEGRVGPPTIHTNTPTSFPDLCDPCTKSSITTAIKCLPQSRARDAALCALDLITSKSFKDLSKATKGCVKKVKKVFDCRKLIKKTITTCIKQALGTKSKNSTTQKSSSIGIWDDILEDLEKIDEAENATLDKIDEYLKNPTVRESDDFILLLPEVQTHFDEKTAFTSNDIVRIKASLKNTSITPDYIDAFTKRWNSTLEAWSKNIFSPNTQYPNIVDKVKVDEYQTIIDGLQVYLTERGFISASEMLDNAYKNLKEFEEEKSQEEASVCATVTIEFPQRLTMTREAFEGTLTINNSSDKQIRDIELDLIVKNEIGEDKSNLFQINKDTFLDGMAVVNPKDKGTGKVIFIPTKEAAPQVKQSYSFGGVLSYFDEEVGERVNVTLNPVTLEVNPSPDLILDYFLQRDIFGDDPLTENVFEPSIPAELSLMITNDGYGGAKNLTVASLQPRIVDNEKGLAIDFEMIGSNFNSEPKQLGLLDVDFGTINPKTSAVGQWYFTSSLIGKFVKYDIEVNHKSDFSNKNLSLIKEANVHELIKSVKAYQEGNDDIDDFLVNDRADAKDTPDRIYFSNGTSEEVVKVGAISASNTISSTSLTTKLQVNPSSTGWNYENIKDPGKSMYRLSRVVRDIDGVEIPLENVWQTSVTLRDGLNPKYENNLHFLDKISSVTTYTLTYIPKDTNTPKIIAIEGVPEDKSTDIPITSLIVKFSKEIDASTFTANSIKVIHQGQNVPSAGILITKIDATTYTISLEAITQLSGFYQLNISTIDIKDIPGNTGETAKQVSWIQFLNELGILKFESDQLKKSPINSVMITFNKQVISEDFTNENITINDQPAGANLVISKVDDFNYLISGINTYNEENGDYTLAVDLPEIGAVDGTAGLIKQSFNWKVDTDTPRILQIIPISQGGTHTQNITELHLELSRKLFNELDSNSIVFSKNGQRISIPITIQQISDLEYKILGLGGYTTENANYSVRIDQTGLQDENNNFGEGFAENSWTVKLNELIGLSDIKIVPDIGFSNTDNITSGSTIKLEYRTLKDNLTVEVYELLATSEVLSYSHQRAKAGIYRIPLTDKVGAKRFKVLAIDATGNRSTPEIVSMFIDFSDIIATITTAKVGSNDCYDFDYAEVSFSEEIDDATFTLDAITLRSSSTVIPKGNVIIEKINNKNYKIKNITFDGDDRIYLDIDKTKIVKKISGKYGKTMASAELGILDNYSPVITGEAEPIVDVTYTYEASSNLRKYDWAVINGEIVSVARNSVSVRWNEPGEQSLILRYETPFGCVSTISKKVIVVGDDCTDCTNCKENVEVIQNVTGGSIDDQMASTLLTAANRIEDKATASYSAGYKVVLQKSFKAVKGSKFKASIQECVPTNSLSIREVVDNKVEEDFFDNIKVYPNPNRGEFNIEFLQESTGYLELYTVEGKLILRETFNGVQTQTVRNITKEEGMYFLIIKIENAAYSKTIIQRK